MVNKKFSRNHKINKMKPGMIHLLLDQENLKILQILKIKKKTKKIIKNFKKNCKKDLKTRVTFILKRIYFQ